MPQLDFFMFFNVQINLMFLLMALVLFIVNVYLFNMFLLSIKDMLISLELIKIKINWQLNKVVPTVYLIDIALIIMGFFKNSYVNLLIGFPNKPSTLVGFQTPASTDMAAIISTHNDIYYYLTLILVVVVWFLVFATVKNTQYIYTGDDTIIRSKLMAEKFDSCTLLEIIWTVVPTALLTIIGYPSISLLYSLDEHVDSDFLVKIIGHQWYWTYEYPEFGSKQGTCLSYDSNPIPQRYWDSHKLDVRVKTSKFPDASTRYITVDNPLILPAYLRIQAIVTSSDVLHSWAVPALGIKIDACPGRLNKVNFKVDIDSRVYQENLKAPVFNKIAKKHKDHNSLPYFTGYVGQCSEFCGIGHGFMPIVVHAIEPEDYFRMFDWFLFKLEHRVKTKYNFKTNDPLFLNTEYKFPGYVDCPDNVFFKETNSGIISKHKQPMKLLIWLTSEEWKKHSPSIGGEKRARQVRNQTDIISALFVAWVDNAPGDKQLAAQMRFLSKVFDEWHRVIQPGNEADYELAKKRYNLWLEHIRKEDRNKKTS